MQITVLLAMNPAWKMRNAERSNFLNRFNSISLSASPLADNCLSGGKNKVLRTNTSSQRMLLKCPTEYWHFASKSFRI